MLVDALTAPEVRPQVVQACCDLVEREVDRKSGLSGLAIKAGYKVVKAIKPGMIPGVIDTLLPEFAQALEPLAQRSADGGGVTGEGFARWLGDHRDEAADALLGVTDARAQRAKNATVRKTYEKLRGSARDNVREAVPGLAETLRPFLPAR
jgi:hypothetical protein